MIETATTTDIVRSPRGMRLGVVRELLAELDSVTDAGRRFTMDKVLGLLSDEVGSVASELTELQVRALARALADLGRERARLLPSNDLFVVRSQIITDTLALV